MSKSSSWERKRKIRRGEPLEWNNLKFYPVTMKDYEEFLDVKNAWLARQSTFPLEYMAMPFLSAVWAMDYDSVRACGKSIGLFERIIRFLYLSLRLEYEAESAFKQIYIDTQNPREIKSVTVTQDGNAVTITPKDFAVYVRPLIAEQNGLELPDESYNPELVAAERDLARDNSSNLKYDIDTLISSVAYVSGLDEKTIDEWTVLQFERRLHAIERDKNFTLYRQAEMSGMVKFKKGNPFPSWCFDKEEGLSPVLRTAADVNENVKAVGDINAAAQQAQQAQH